MQEDMQTERGNSRVAAATPMFGQRLGSPLGSLIKAKESTLSWGRSCVVASTELFPSLDWCWKGLSQCGTFSRCLWVQEQSEEQFFSIFLLQTSSSKALIANCKILVTKWWQATKHFHVFVEAMCTSPVAVRARSWVTVQSLELSTRSVCWLCPTIPLPTWAHPVSDSPAPPGLLLGARASQGSCGANLLHGISGMAWLSSAQRGRSSAGRACFVSCAAASVCFVDCSKLWGLFLFLRGFMVTWWCGWVRRRFLLVALLYNHCISIWCHRWRLLSGSGNNTS